MRPEFLTGHVTFKLRYNQIYQMKTTHATINVVSNLQDNFET